MLLLLDFSLILPELLLLLYSGLVFLSFNGVVVVVVAPPGMFMPVYPLLISSLSALAAETYYYRLTCCLILFS